MHPREQTIFAVSSGRPPTAIAIVRVSGPEAKRALEAIARCQPAPRVARRARLADAQGDPIDDALVLWFPGPASATGEDVAEFHIHGGRAVIAALVAALSALDGLRPAEPGEFTRRAFEYGKLDLTEAEGLDDLIHADTDRQRRQALRQLNGLLGDRARAWRQRIIEASALIEAGIDFVDEDDVPAEVREAALGKAAALHDEIAAVLASSAHGERLRDGLVVAIAGAPNVGKSTLMNALARREVAIVSPHAGTTRDVIEVQLDLDGYPVTLIDTAGIRATDDPVEQEGVRRALARAAAADLVLWLEEADRAGEAMPPAEGVPVWRVRNKVDLTGPAGAGNGAQNAAEKPRQSGDGNVAGAAGPTFAISAARGDGMAALVAALARFAADYFGGTEGSLVSRERHRRLLRDAAAMLRRSIELRGAGDELIAEELRGAAAALGRLLGRIDVEDLLDVIFRDFCIGK